MFFKEIFCQLWNSEGLFDIVKNFLVEIFKVYITPFFQETIKSNAKKSLNFTMLKTVKNGRYNTCRKS
jgi:hypothetical protein